MVVEILHEFKNSTCQHCKTWIKLLGSSETSAEWLHANTLDRQCAGAPLAEPIDE